MVDVFEALAQGWTLQGLTTEGRLCFLTGPHCRGCGEQVLVGTDPHGTAVEKVLVGTKLLPHRCERFDPVRRQAESFSHLGGAAPSGGGRSGRV